MVGFGKALYYLHGAHIVVGNPILGQQRCEVLGCLAGFMARPDIGGKTENQASSIMEATSHAPGEAHVITSCTLLNYKRYPATVNTDVANVAAHYRGSTEHVYAAAG
jgi:hypothetical protein